MKRKLSDKQLLRALRQLTDAPKDSQDQVAEKILLLYKMKKASQ